MIKEKQYLYVIIFKANICLPDGEGSESVSLVEYHRSSSGVCALPLYGNVARIIKKFQRT